MLAVSLLVVICGVLLLAAPTQAAQNGKVDLAQVQAASHQVERQADVIHTVWNAIKFQIGSWFGISAPPVQIPSDDHSSGPQYDGTDPKTRSNFNEAVYYDNCGDIAI